MDVFAFRDHLVAEYERFTRSFIRIRAGDIKAHIDREYAAERFWPASLIQLNPFFVPGGDIGKFVARGLLHPECKRICRSGKTDHGALGKALTLHKHQEDAIRIARRRKSYVLTTGTGSGRIGPGVCACARAVAGWMIQAMIAAASARLLVPCGLGNAEYIRRRWRAGQHRCQSRTGPECFIDLSRIPRDGPGLPLIIMDGKLSSACRSSCLDGGAGPCLDRSNGGRPSLQTTI